MGETSTTSSTSSVFATTSESPSPGTTATTMVPNPTTTMNQQTIMTTQPSMSQDTDVTVVQDIDDTTTDIPMMLEAMGKENLQEILIEDYQEGFIPDDSNYSTDYSDEEDLETEEETVEELRRRLLKVDYSGESMNACPVKEEVFAPS